MTGDLRIIAVTDPGCEEACAAETARILARDTRTRRNLVELTGSWEDAAILAYRSQTALRVLVAIAPAARDLDDLTAHPPDKGVIAAAVPSDGTFKAIGELFDTAPQEFVERIGAWVHGTGVPVNLSRPDVTIVGVATPDGIDAGIDVMGLPLAKRDWRVMLSSRSIKGTIAASAAVYADLRAGHTVLDPFGDDGSLAIEAAMLLSGTSPRAFTRSFAFTRFPILGGFDWPTRKKRIDDGAEPGSPVIALSDTLRDLKAIRTNAKLAGVDVHSTKVALDWVDLKLGDKSIDRILTAPITSGKVISQQRAKKLVDRLFDQAAVILRDGGTVTCVTDKPEELDDAAARHGFEMARRHDVRMGERRLAIVTFGAERQ